MSIAKKSRRASLLVAFCLCVSGIAPAQEFWLGVSAGALGVSLPGDFDLGWIAPGGSVNFEFRELGRSHFAVGIGANYNYLLEDAYWVTDIQFIQGSALLGFRLPLGKSFSISPRIGGGAGFMTVNYAVTTEDYDNGTYTRDWSFQAIASGGIAFGIFLTDVWTLNLYPEYRFLVTPDNYGQNFSLQLSSDFRLWKARKRPAGAKYASAEKAEDKTAPKAETKKDVSTKSGQKAKQAPLPDTPQAKAVKTEAVKAPSPTPTPTPTPTPAPTKAPSKTPEPRKTLTPTQAPAAVGQTAPNNPFASLPKYRNVTVRQNGKTIKVTVESIFEANSSELGTAARNQLAEIGSILKKLSVASIRIDGFAMDDNDLETKNNAALSSERAVSVKAFMAQAGYFNALQAPAETAGRGVQAPVASNATTEGRKRNRRVEILITLN